MKTSLFYDKLATTKIKSLGVSLTTYYMGGNYLAYKMYVNGKLLFKGSDYRPSILNDIDSLISSIDLLGFLSTGIHDTDSEYFKNYTQKQLDWANDIGGLISIREQLSGIINDLSDASNEAYNWALKQVKHKTH